MKKKNPPLPFIIEDEPKRKRKNKPPLPFIIEDDSSIPEEYIWHHPKKSKKNIVLKGKVNNKSKKNITSRKMLIANSVQPNHINS